MKDRARDIKRSLMTKLDNLKTQQNSHNVDELKTDLEKFHKSISVEISILNAQIEKNERRISTTSRALSDLRSYVVAAVESDQRKSSKKINFFTGLRERSRGLNAFLNDHGPIIAYTLLLTGLTALTTYFFLTSSS